jgi:hypothetical protein
MSLFQSTLKLVSIIIIIIRSEFCFHSKVRQQYAVLAEQIILLSHSRRKSEALETEGDISIWREDRAAPVSAYTPIFISFKFEKLLYLRTQKLVVPGILSWFLATPLFFSPVILAHVHKSIFRNKKLRCVLLFFLHQNTYNSGVCLNSRRILQTCATPLSVFMFVSPWGHTRCYVRIESWN